MSESNNIGQRIKSLRKKHGLKQADFVAGLDITSSYLSKLEHGLERPGRELLTKMAKEYDVSIDWLLNGTSSDSTIHAESQNEALLLYAYRSMPPDEAETLLKLILQRVNKDKTKT